MPCLRPWHMCTITGSQSFLSLIIARAARPSQACHHLSYSCVYHRPGKRKLDPRLRQSLFQSRSALLLACSSSWPLLVAPMLHSSQWTAGLSCLLKHGLWIFLFPVVGTTPMLFIRFLSLELWISESQLSQEAPLSQYHPRHVGHQRLFLEKRRKGSDRGPVRREMGREGDSGNSFSSEWRE